MSMCMLKLIKHSDVASPICQEGQSKRLFQIFSLPAMPQAFVSYEFLSSSSSGNTSFSHTSLHPILTKLGHSDQYLNHYSGTNNDGVRGHDGVTGVKN